MNDGSAPLAAGQKNGTHPLAGRSDFRLGSAWVRPSLLTVEGPGGTAKGEPRVFRVLVALADARGAVLSRDDLLQQSWDGVIVGDDAINRAVAELRRLAAAVDAGFAVETVPRVGYRLSVTSGGEPHDVLAAGPREPGGIDRRVALIGGGALAVAAVGGALSFRGWRRTAHVDALVEQGRILQASGEPDAQRRAAALFRKALEADPSRADAWGWLAVVTIDKPEAVDNAQRALAIDPKEPNARAALAFRQRDLDNWVAYEDRLLAILRDAPRCAFALSELTIFYQGMGRCRASLATNERAIAIEPFNPLYQGRRALKHWVFGDLAKADLVAKRALELWPRNPTVWNARFIILAFTNRPAAARILLMDEAQRPANATPMTVAAWQAGLQAIASRAPGDMARAVERMGDAATQSPGMAANAIMTFSLLGLVDDAYRVADGLLAQVGNVLQRTDRKRTGDFYSVSVWGRTQFLFVPACSSLRADARFTDLCRRTGLLAYWSERGVAPDGFVRGSLKLG